MSFPTIDIAATGLATAQLWLDTVGHNLANANTVRPGDAEPFRAQVVLARERRGILAEPGRGVEVAGVLRQEGEPPRVFDPHHPAADPAGYVVHPVVDVGGQMVDLIVAQRTYQANLQVLRDAQEAYQMALRLGRQ